MKRCWLLLAAGICGVASAQQKHDLVVYVGPLYTHPLGTSGVVHTELASTTLGSLLGIPNSFDSAGTSVKPGNSLTALTEFQYFFTDHIAVSIDGGYPPRFDVQGRGVVSPSGLFGTVFRVDLGAPASNPIVSVREWSPAVLALYHFGTPKTSPLRPHVGVGLTYVWYSGTRLGSAFQDALNTQFGNVLAFASGKAGPTHAYAHTSRSFAPVFNAGLSLRLTNHWGIATAASYSLLGTNATIDLVSADHTALAHAHTHVDLDPLVFSLVVDYRIACFPFGC